jgi:hypothetical protein
MQTPRLRPKNLGKKKKPSKKPKLRPAGLGATKEEMDAMERGFRIQKMEGREREAMKKASGGKLKMVKKGGKSVPFYAADGVGKMAYGGKAKVKKMGMGGKCRGMGKATQGGNYSKMG